MRKAELVFQSSGEERKVQVGNGPLPSKTSKGNPDDRDDKKRSLDTSECSEESSGGSVDPRLDLASAKARRRNILLASPKFRRFMLRRKLEL